MSSTLLIEKTVRWEAPDLGGRIKEARSNDPRPVWKIAADAGMSAQNWYRIEKEGQILPLETLRRIEQVLGVDFGVCEPEAS